MCFKNIDCSGGEKKIIIYFHFALNRLSNRSIIHTAAVKYAMNILPGHCGIKLA